MRAMVRVSAPFVVAMALLAAGPAAADEVALPDSEAGRRVVSWFQAYNAGTEAALVAFFAANVPPEELERRPARERAARTLGLRRETGELRVGRVVRSTPDAVAVMAANGRGEWFELSLAFEQAAPHRLVGVRIEQGEPPSEDDDQPLSIEAALAALDAFVGERAAKDEFSGAVLIARGDRVLFEKAWGHADRAFAVPNRIDTRFCLGSINKLFTRIAVAQLVAAGKLSLDDRLGTWLPDYPNAAAREKVTVRQLVQMSSGIGDFFNERYEALPKDRLRANADYLPLFAADPLLFEPGTGNRYSNGGYAVLGEVVARAVGEDYYEVVREGIYAPAGMTASDSFELDAIVPNLAEGYTRDAGPGLRRNVYTKPARGSAAGGGYSTVRDMLAFSRALLANRLASPEWTAWVMGGPEPGQGRAGAAPQAPGIGVAGGAPGMNAMLEIEASDATTIVVLANLDPPSAGTVARQARSLLRRVRE
jgi:CubicO group peptidase (beta-lactamase class C family)